MIITERKLISGLPLVRANDLGKLTAGLQIIQNRLALRLTANLFRNRLDQTLVTTAGKTSKMVEHKLQR